MSSIVSNTIILDKGTTERIIAFQIVLADNNGVQEVIDIGPIIADETYDEKAEVIKAGIEAIEDKLSNEDEAQVDLAEDGDALSRALTPQWSTTQRIARVLMLWLLGNDDPRTVILLEPLYNWINQEHPGSLRAKYLDITTEEGLQLDRRVKSVLTDSGTMKAQMLVFDSEKLVLDSEKLTVETQKIG